MANPQDFETSLAELESVVAELDGELKLERALELFDRGIKLSSACEKFLKGAEQKIEILRRSPDGEIFTEDFDSPTAEVVSQAVAAVSGVASTK